ncbi:MAG: DAK2 domain-containing protein [Clostridia bacterium]|nr:DAK2 domain-containing protein [Clostridia bacterium]
MNNTIGGALLREMFLTGAALLDKNKALIDSLNVFPVPDGDTGTNMHMTMQGAVKEIREVKSEKVADVAAAASLGSLKGARGNSGVILSQILRGFSRALAGAEEMDAQLLAQALKTGTEAAYKAVMKPKEGTMLTVSRMIGEAVEKAAEEGANVYKLIDLIIESGEAALRITPDLLPVLKEAGVVDSGGKGLVTIFRGFKMAIDGEEIEDYVDDCTASSAVEETAGFEDLEDIKFGYCTEFFIIHLDESFTEADLDRLREKLMKIGDSVVIAHDADFVKVHVHSNCPGKILQLALRLGEVDRIKIENMREQNREILENLKKNEKESAMVAVSSGDGIEEVFTSLGVAASVQGGQTMNPSIETIGHAIKKANARNVFVLPNNSNIILAAQQAAELSDRNVIVIPTKAMVQGVAAAIAFDPDAAPEDNEAAMKEAFANVVSGSVTYAVRDTHVNGNDIHEGNIIGLMNGTIEEVGESVEAVSMALVDRMVAEKSEDAIITVFYGSDVTEDTANAFAEAVSEKYPDAECMVQRGGQPLYYYYISVE